MASSSRGTSNTAPHVIELNVSVFAAILVAVIALISVGVCLGSNLSGLKRRASSVGSNGSSPSSTPKKKRPKAKSVSGPATPTPDKEREKDEVEDEDDGEVSASSPPARISGSQSKVTPSPPSSSSKPSPLPLNTTASGSNDNGFIEAGKKKKTGSGATSASATVTASSAPVPLQGLQGVTAVPAQAARIQEQGAKKVTPALAPATAPASAPVAASKPEPVAVAPAAVATAPPAPAAVAEPMTQLSSPSLDDFLARDTEALRLQQPVEDEGSWETVDKSRGRGKRIVEEPTATAQKKGEDVISPKRGVVATASRDRTTPAAPSPSPTSTPTALFTASATVEVEAEAEAEQAAPEPARDHITETFTVNAQRLGYLIGTRGATRHALQGKTGTVIGVPRTDKDAEGPVDVTVSGPAEGVAKAIKALQELQVKGYATLLGGDDFTETEISIYPPILSEIIGHKGTSIKAIQEHTGVRVTIPQLVDRSDTQPLVLGLAGPHAKVLEAKDIVRSISLYHHHPVSHPGIAHAELDFPQSLYSSIIGAKGAEIKNINSTYKVTVHVPSAVTMALPADIVNRNVVVVGEQAGVAGAVAHLQTKLDEYNAKLAAAAEREAAKAREAAAVAAEKAAAAAAEAAEAAAAAAASTSASASASASSGAASQESSSTAATTTATAATTTVEGAASPSPSSSTPSPSSSVRTWAAMAASKSHG